MAAAMRSMNGVSASARGTSNEYRYSLPADRSFDFGGHYACLNHATTGSRLILYSRSLFGSGGIERLVFIRPLCGFIDWRDPSRTYRCNGCDRVPKHCRHVWADSRDV